MQPTAGGVPVLFAYGFACGHLAASGAVYPAAELVQTETAYSYRDWIPGLGVRQNETAPPPTEMIRDQFGGWEPCYDEMADLAASASYHLKVQIPLHLRSRNDFPVNDYSDLLGES
jgi:hypothetical protein